MVLASVKSIASRLILGWSHILHSYTVASSLRTTLARFRLGQHWLQIRLGRFGPHRVPYESRWCQHCASFNQHKAVDSEEHALFECPLYHDLRQQQPRAQQQPCSLPAFMALPPLQQASFCSSLLRSAFRKG